MEWWSNGALQNIKFQAPSLRVSGVGCQVSGTKDKKTETSTKARHLHRQSRLTQTCPVYQVAGTAMEF